ncbi:ABC transporter permease [Paenibacillus marinisediminis]
MLLRMLSSDRLKLRRTWIFALVFLGPCGVIGLQAVNWGRRYDYLINKYKDDLWGTLLLDVSYLALPALLLGITLVASILCSIEHREQSWKQLLSLPVRRTTVFLSKFIWIQILLFLACTLLTAGTLLLGTLLGFRAGEIPWADLFVLCYLPWLAAMPIIAVQLWVSLVMKNQATALTLGILLTVMSLYAMQLPNWVPLKWPMLPAEMGGAGVSVAAGMITGLVIACMSLVHFVRKDVA